MNIWTDISNAVNKVSWSFESHDPVWAWVVVAMYLLATVLCLKALFAVQSSLFPRAIVRKCRIFWLFLFALMLFLAFNKQLDIQTYITAVAREVAHTEGWYSERRVFQRDAIIVLGLIGLLTLSYFVYIIYRLPSSYKVALLGALFTFSFIGMRASSFHHLDHYVAQTVYGVKLHIFVEVMGGVIVSLGALLSVLGIKKWEKYYDINYLDEDMQSFVDPDYDSDDEEDTDYFEEDYGVADVECEVEVSSALDADISASEVAVNKRAVQNNFTLGNDCGGEYSNDMLTPASISTDDEIIYSEEMSSLFELVSNPAFKKNAKSDGVMVGDNSTPRVTRARMSVINRKRKKILKEAALKDESAKKQQSSRSNNNKDSWLRINDDKNGWIH